MRIQNVCEDRWRSTRRIITKREPMKRAAQGRAVKQPQGASCIAAFLMNRTEQSVELPGGELQHCFVVAGKRNARGLSDFDLFDEKKVVARSVACWSVLEHRSVRGLVIVRDYRPKPIRRHWQGPDA